MSINVSVMDRRVSRISDKRCNLVGSPYHFPVDDQSSLSDVFAKIKFKITVKLQQREHHSQYR